jgi:hypothetical protein
MFKTVPAGILMAVFFVGDASARLPLNQTNDERRRNAAVRDTSVEREKRTVNTFDFWVVGFMVRNNR